MGNCKCENSGYYLSLQSDRNGFLPADSLDTRSCIVYLSVNVGTKSVFHKACEALLRRKMVCDLSFSSLRKQCNALYTNESIAKESFAHGLLLHTHLVKCFELHRDISSQQLCSFEDLLIALL